MLRVTESALMNVGDTPIGSRNGAVLGGGALRMNLRMTCRLSYEMKQYPIRKRADKD